MLILGIDTSARQSSIALLHAEGREASTVELVTLGEGRASELLMPAIDALLARHGVEKGSLSLVAVASGPGSFTGLRVAIATAKGLAEAFAIPVVPVSLLEAVALASHAEGRVVAAMDAQRGELFFGEYVLAASATAQCLREGIASFAYFASEFAGSAGTLPLRVFTSDAAVAERLREATASEAKLEVAVLARPSAEDIARIAHRKFLSGVRADVAALDANYLRRSDAEIVFSRKPGAAGQPR